MSQYDEVENQQDANTPEPSAPESSSDETQKQQTSASDEGEGAKQVPFHEHPRFKELIEERRQYAEKQTAYERQLESLQRSLQEVQTRNKPAPQEDPLLSRLKGIDPEFGKWAEQQSQAAKEMAEFRAWRQQTEQQATVREYESTVGKLHSDNKVPDELKGLYDRALKAEFMANPNLGMKDVPQVYKTLHAELSKVLEGRDRATRASYVSDKSKDSLAPNTQPKGKPASSKGKSEFTGDRETDLAMLAKRAHKLVKAESDI
jgi:uncharacterized phage infection (PIP) family protein YhgE